MHTIKTTIFLKSILIVIFLFNSFQSFGATIHKRKCAEAFNFAKNKPLTANLIPETSLESSFGYSFKNQKLKYRALTRRNRSDLKTYYKHNTLEFLGDAVLGLFVAELLVRRYPQTNKKKLHNMWSFLVSNSIFAEWALTLKLDRYILDRSIRTHANNVRYNETQNPYLTLADFLEALVGAVYLDGGYIEAKRLVFRLANLPTPSRDYMRLLAEVISKRFPEKLVYYILKEKNQHSPYHIFVARTQIGNHFIGLGKGSRKKIATQRAALDTLKKLNINISPTPINYSPFNQSLMQFPGLRGMKSIHPSLFYFHYNRLVFLGHAVFNFHVISVLLKQQHIYSPKALMKKKKLFKSFIELRNLPKDLQMTIIEVFNNRPIQERNLHDSFYFLLGAIYLEKGYKETEVLVTNLLQKNALLRIYEHK